MVAEAYEMRDTRLENSNGMKKQADKERVREIEREGSKEGLNFTIKEE